LSVEPEPRGRLIAIEIDARSLAPTQSFIDDERTQAIHDLISDNLFSPIGQHGDSFQARLSLVDGKLALDVSNAEGELVVRHVLSLTPLRRVVKDYFLICDAYFAAMRTATPSQIEAIDVGRRGLHNEGAEILRDRLNGKILLDFATARRLFTLVCALHWRG
jgi:uncharacterized protein (UPF0262 family)